MPSLVALVVGALSLLGSTALWISFLNRSHGLGIWRPLIHGCSAASLVGLMLGPAVVLAGVTRLFPANSGQLPALLAQTPGISIVAGRVPANVCGAYTAICAIAAVLVIAAWLPRRLKPHQPRQLLSNHTTQWILANGAGTTRYTHGLGRLAALIPGNEILRVEIHEKTLALPKLPERLEGLSIAHLTDFHFSGRIARDFFRDVVDRTNKLSPDLVAITGDIVDVARCIDWIPETLGRLVAPCGVYYVLGNHDRRVDLSRLRHALDDAGLTNLGGRWRKLEIAGHPVILAGNELPWIKPAADLAGCPSSSDGVRPLRILLSHSPDQFGWARKRGFDLMLAGHTHGGQIQFPLLGPLLAPSLYGTKYAAGTFFRSPTLLHVSRGISALTPVRFKCPPELALLRLRLAAATPDDCEEAREGEGEFVRWT